MAVLLGKLLWWASILITVCWVGYSFKVTEYYSPMIYGLAIIILLVGLAARLMLAGDKQA
jgi:hypothetical protein